MRLLNSAERRKRTRNLLQSLCANDEKAKIVGLKCGMKSKS